MCVYAFVRACVCTCMCVSTCVTACVCVLCTCMCVDLCPCVCPCVLPTASECFTACEGDVLCPHGELLVPRELLLPPALGRSSELGKQGRALHMAKRGRSQG